MTDQTPVTDDDRRTAYEWAASLDPDIRCWTDRERTAARVILATVPAPTLSEEWRDMLEKQDAGEVVSFSGLLARTVQMEHELAEALDSRLVPAPRAITAPGELDALAEGAIVQHRITHYAYQKIGSKWYTPGIVAPSRSGSDIGPVTVLWEPGGMTNHNHQAPPATLADELRVMLEKRDAGEVTSFAGLLARVEAVEKENRAALNHAYDERDEALVERDEARAEVERLTVSLNRQCTTVTPSVHNTDALPDPADVPEGEAWAVKADDRNAVGVRDGVAPTASWSIIDTEFGGGDRLPDSYITLVARLVPERPAHTIERPEDLDALPSGSSVRRDCRVWSKCWPEGWRGVGYSVEFTPADILQGGPVTVIYTPEEEQA